MQDDLLYENLTVRETLYYAAMLKLPRSMSVKEKTRRVDLTIKALGISDCQHTIVGEQFSCSTFSFRIDASPQVCRVPG